MGSHYGRGGAPESSRAGDQRRALTNLLAEFRPLQEPAVALPNSVGNADCQRTYAQKLATEARAIESRDALSAGALGFMARPLVQATLPHRDLRQSAFDRQNGILRLSIYAHPDTGLPYGRYARLLLV